MVFSEPITELVKRLGSDPEKGLSSARAEDALGVHGPNSLREKKKKSLLHRFLLQLWNPMVLILIAAAVISFILALVSEEGEFIDPAVIIIIVILNAVLGLSQESKAQRSLDALKNLSAPYAKVVRDGSLCKIPAAELVPGDIIVLEAGDFVPADARLIEAASLRCEESSLTGESVPSEKKADIHVPEDASLGDRPNMVHSGCAVTYGRGRALVTATGMNTEMGKIATLLESAGSETTPLQKKLGAMGKTLGLLAIAVCVIIFITGLLQKLPPLTMFMTAVSLAVAAIPEGMTAVVTIVLALGVQRMASRGAIVRRLPAVETLGSASVICSDKTGTLTLNQMTVRKLWTAGGKLLDLPQEQALPSEAEQLLRLGALCCDGRVEKDENGALRHIGDPTETAIVAAALNSGLEKSALEREYPRIAELPFDSERKLMTTVHRVEGKIISITKGGLDVLLPLCPGTEGNSARQVNQLMGKSALRVLALGCRELAEEPVNVAEGELERDLVFIGLIGMIDPPREESREAVKLCREAGIRTVMITGDHEVTASAVAGELGILREGDETLKGSELVDMNDEELVENIRRYSVYSRVSPEDKIRIVKAWQAVGEVVSMTGDGVNDAPALKAADIGCAMGITGTDVAKDAADMVLTDDNFSTIVEAVRQGRGIFDNIKKTILFLLGCNLGEIIAVFFSMIFGWGPPLLAIHLLLINVVTDAFPALALGIEPVEPDIMSRKPVPADSGIFAGGLGIRVLWQGAMVGVLTLIAYRVGCVAAVSEFVPASTGVGMTMAFLVLCLSQLSQALNCRSEKSIFKIGLSSNKAMLGAIAVSGGIAVLICALPPLERLFRLEDLSMLHWLIALGLSLAPLAVSEAVKAAQSAMQNKTQA